LLEKQLSVILGQHTADKNSSGILTRSLCSNLHPQAHSRPQATCHCCPGAGNKGRGCWWVGSFQFEWNCYTATCPALLPE